MKDYQIKDIDSLDAEEFVEKVMISCNIEFTENELRHISTISEFCEYTVSKMGLSKSNDCTSQQAFYKLREVLAKECQIDPKAISPKLLVKTILPKHNQRSAILNIEANLGFKLNILRPSYWITTILFVIFITSFVIIFSNWQAGMIGLITSIVGFNISKIVANQLNTKTIEDIVQKMVRYNYLKSRRDSRTFNKRELKQNLITWFEEEYG